MAIKIAGTEVISDDKRILNNESLPDIRPSLLLDFANSKTLDPRITFTRGSTATYWDGKTTAKAEENLLTYSQDWTNGAWGKSATTATGDNTTAPDGTTTADLIEVPIAGTFIGVTQDISASSSTNYTASVYIKKSNYNYIRFGLDNRNNGSYVSGLSDIAINLSDGSTTYSSGTVSITDVGNSWYKLTVSGTTPSSGTNQLRCLIYFTNASGSISGTDIPAGSQVYLWGAQLEQRSSATAYTPTTSSAIVKYQPVLQTAASGEARFDHDPVTGESKGLLIEEARTNLVPASESTNYAFQYTTSTGLSVAPDGSNTAIQATPNTLTTTDHYIHETQVAVSTSTTYTMSQFVKKGYYQYHFLRSVFANGDYDLRTVFDLDNGTITSQLSDIDDASITDIGNGWYRVSVTYTTPATLPNPTLLFRFHIGASSSYAGNGHDYTLCWGSQVEVGSFPTSYIPTSGSTVTRAAENAYMTDLSMFAPNEFTVYVEGKHPPLNEYRRLVDVGDDSGGSNNNTVCLFGNPAGNLTTSIRINGTAQGGPSTLMVSHARGDNIKAAIAVAKNDAAASADGLTPTTDTTLNFAGVNFNRIWIGRGTEGYPNRYADEAISKIAIYPKRLPNATLQAMTEE